MILPCVFKKIVIILQGRALNELVRKNNYQDFKQIK